MLNPIFIKATTLESAWFQLIYATLENGGVFKIDQGSYAGQKRLELDYVTIHITHPETLPLLPQVPAQYNIPNPVESEYLDEYLPYLMTGVEKPGEAYTYGQRICCEKIDKMLVYALYETDLIKKETEIWNDHSIIDNKDMNGRKFGRFLNQMELMIWTYKNKGYRNNQMILQVGKPTDMILNDPPCLRHIDTRIQNGKLHFYPYFRSWDLYGGFPANLAAIEMMKQYCADAIGVENGEIIASSKALHLYDYVFELAEMLRGRKIDENNKKEK